MRDRSAMAATARRAQWRRAGGADRTTLPDGCVRYRRRRMERRARVCVVWYMLVHPVDVVTGRGF